MVTRLQKKNKQKIDRDLQNVLQFMCEHNSSYSAPKKPIKVKTVSLGITCSLIPKFSLWHYDWAHYSRNSAFLSKLAEQGLHWKKSQIRRLCVFWPVLFPLIIQHYSGYGRCLTKFKHCKFINARFRKKSKWPW